MRGNRISQTISEDTNVESNPNFLQLGDNLYTSLRTLKGLLIYRRGCAACYKNIPLFKVRVILINAKSCIVSRFKSIFNPDEILLFDPKAAAADDHDDDVDDNRPRPPTTPKNTLSFQYDQKCL